jgi:hypothetical protein
VRIIAAAFFLITNGSCGQRQAYIRQPFEERGGPFKGRVHRDLPTLVYFYGTVSCTLALTRSSLIVIKN